MDILRWLDDSNKGLFLGVRCSLYDLEDLVECINSSVVLHNTTGQWMQGGPHSQLKGDQRGAFCGPSGNLSMYIERDYPYHCTSGAEASSVRVLKDEIDALKAVQKYAYFRCVTYDELFAVYVGVIGVTIAVALTTTTLFFTDVVRPMLLAGRRSWTWDFKNRSVGLPSISSEDYPTGQCMLEGDVLDMVLRCAAALAGGSVLGMSVVYVPWRTFLDGQGQACDEAY